MFELVALHETDPKRVAHFLEINRERFQPFAPTRTDHYFTDRHWREACKLAKSEWKEDRAYRFCIIHKGEEVIGKVDLDQIIRGPFQSAVLGYMLDRRHEGQSVMRRALDDVLDLAFGEFELHRVQAAIMPHNERSRTLIKRLGFREIGLAERHLLLDGEWKDHILYEKIAR
ncbi:MULTISPECIES: GNAT family N-acetyltransferase [Henriciella]|jgi:ribosomal-protein-alanine N-acetyltransferase|uniref:Ribosomal protein S5 alanine N-acetyltransferase n=1 Tax=Henriciella pelagia TaxID=1977912 RepID=A0ABQ1JBA8_9PROT|nr:GNAT family N-acetyltransferase [Henriciella pelagia]GGB63152.1 ribosomal protein S5 alanine N-acetyltransferase [Henriciella pelagia]